MITAKQLEQRRNYVGASDSSAICLDRDGTPFNPWQNPMDVYHSKVDAIDVEVNEAMMTGNRLESAIIKYAEEVLKITVTTRNLFRVKSGQETGSGIMAANMDAWVVEKPWGIEAKYVGPGSAQFWGESGSDEIPPHVMIQAQHQMAVTPRLERIYVAAAIARLSLEWCLYPIDRDEDIIRYISESCERFWKDHVVLKVPPSQWTAKLETLENVKRIPKKVVLLPAEMVDCWKQTNDIANKLTTGAEGWKAVVLQGMGDAEAAEFGHDEKVITYYEQSRKTVDIEKMKEDGIYKDYVKTSKSRVFRLVKRPKEFPALSQDETETPKQLEVETNGN